MAACVYGSRVGRGWRELCGHQKVFATCPPHISHTEGVAGTLLLRPQQGTLGQMAKIRGRCALCCPCIQAAFMLGCVSHQVCVVSWISAKPCSYSSLGKIVARFTGSANCTMICARAVASSDFCVLGRPIRFTFPVTSINALRLNSWTSASRSPLAAQSKADSFLYARKRAAFI